jgi:hypothetical protein
MPNTSVKLTGVKIGVADDQFDFAVPQTQFSPNDSIAVTVEFNADKDVANFPVRLSTQLASASFGYGDLEQVRDVAHPGDGFHTFRFVPKAGQVWRAGKYLVLVSLDGNRVHAKELDVRLE